jgi:isopenicillin N synthase-like dioxygenase
MAETIPLIDLARLGSPATLAALDRACRDWGLFQLVGHGIDPAMQAQLFGIARAFFAQPMDAKRRLLRDAANPWGYFDRELTKNRLDGKEIYDLGPLHGSEQPQRWPEGALRPRFERVLRVHAGRCKALALRLLAAIAGNLGLANARWAPGFGALHTSFLRLNHYPPQPPGTEPALGVGEHTDAGALTVLLQDEQAGLEVWRHGRWIGVPPLGGALVVNLGDIVQVWSNDAYIAPLHRAVAHPSRHRYSVPFFLNPSYDTHYAPLHDGEPPRYRPISWREFRTLRSAGDHADLGEDVQITHYRTPA